MAKFKINHLTVVPTNYEELEEKSEEKVDC